MYNLLILTIRKKKDFSFINKVYNLNYYKKKKAKVIIKSLANNKKLYIQKDLKKKTFVICLFSKIREYLHYMQYLESKNFFWGFIDLKLSPVPKTNIVNFLRILMIKKNKIYYLLLIFKKKLFKLPNPKFLISINDKNKYSDSKNSNQFLVRTNNFNYDKFIELKKSKKINKKYILYLDEALYFHDDYKYQDFNCHLSNKKSFYIKLTSLFKKLEKKYQMPVYIALYPRFQNLWGFKFFKDFKCISDNTAYMVKNCEVVLAHSSSSIDFAVIYNKPLNLIKSDNFSIYLNLNIAELKNILNVNLLNLEDNCSDINFNIKKKYYSNFFKNFIGKKNETKKSYELIHENFIKYTNKNNF